MAKRPPLSFWQIWNMSFGFLGIQFGFALQNANTSRIFQSLDAKESELAILWLAAPVTGLLVQPLIGYYSDRTWHPRWGRRRPFFAVGAILASLALIYMPNVSTLWVAAGMLWVMDASFNISMEPFRAFVGDMLPPNQRNLGFSMQSFFIGVGAVVASAMPYLLNTLLDIPNVPEAGESIGLSVRMSYYIGAGVLLFAVFYTVFTTKEYPPEAGELKQIQDAPLVIRYKPSTYLSIGVGLLLLALAFGSWVYLKGLEKELYVICGIFGLFGLAYAIAALFMRKGVYRQGFVQMVRDFQNMPKTMIQLAFVQFFSWFGLFAMWIYTTPAVTSHIYGSSDTASELYNKGADWVSLLFASYNGVAAIAAFGIIWLSNRFGRGLTHLIALSLGGAGLISFYYVTDPNWLLLSISGIGVAWASILSIPYAMLSTSIPQEKMGYYMGVFNFFIVIPQIVAASLLGFMLKTYFDSQSIYALIIGGASLILSGLLSLLVNDKDKIEMADPNKV
ncbi:MAG: MFS transporter [Bacteroidetes bacterium]|nr:MAG: MFS transporter [Bacteroidota bacterium]